MTQNRESAEDIAQETFLRATKNKILERWLADDEERTRHASWLFRVARNIWLDQIKSAATRKRANEDFCEPFDRSSEFKPELKEEVTHAMQMMKRLPSTQQQVLFLHVVEEMNTSEIAETMEMTRNSVKVNLSLARKSMRQLCDRKIETRG